MKTSSNFKKFSFKISFVLLFENLEKLFVKFVEFFEALSLLLL
jgi:hypothetical protein